MRVYLDHAATGWPKPEAVYRAMDRYARDVGVAAGRGAYARGAEADRIVAACRRRLAKLIGATHPRNLAFFANGTAALNAGIFGLVRPGDHVISTAIEHNSVLRPLESLRLRAGVTVEIVPCDAQGHVDPQTILDRLLTHTRLVVISHASNVTGAVQPIEVLGSALRETDTLLLCDAAQTLGYLPIDVEAFGVDLLAAPGHKGACGPLGTGLLWVSDRALASLEPTSFGGTGQNSESLEMPSGMPGRLEAGNLNVPALAGWEAGLAWLDGVDLAQRAVEGHRLAETLREVIRDVPGVRAIGAERLPILSLVSSRLENGLVANLLDSEFGIEVRTGLHCAPLIHGFLGTAPHGTLRVSGGHSTSSEELARFGEALGQIVEEADSI